MRKIVGGVLAVVVVCGVAGAEVRTFSCDAKGRGERLGAGSLFVEQSGVTNAENVKGNFGWDLGTVAKIEGKSCVSEGALFFSESVVEGNYRVTVVLGGDRAAVTTVKAEARRLMVEKVATAAGKTTTVSFVVNVRGPEIAGSEKKVKLKPREVGNLDWDQKLTLEFNGERPSVRSIAVERVENLPVVYLAGDSTVVDQDVEPWAAWGQMLPRFFDERVVVANHAESGETTKSFVGELRLAKIMSQIKAGDYLFIQFAHNDQKPQAGITLEIYKAMLKDYVAQARAKGATAVLVTSMNRRTFDDAGHITNSLFGYPGAMREVAAEEKVALIDLNAMSKVMWEAMGPELSKKAFMHYAAGSYPQQDKAIDDDTHFNSYGAYELARCVVRGIRESGLPLRNYLRRDAGEFDPARPDQLDHFSLPTTPLHESLNVMKVPQT